MMGQVQGVSTPLITVQTRTRIEKVRIIRIPKIQYRIIRSFTESSLKASYPWRVAQETPVSFIWRKEGKWLLEVYKRFEPVNFEELPVKGIYKIIDTTISPIAVLKSKAGEILFVLLPRSEVAILHTTPKVHLAFTTQAPIAFIPKTPIPFSRPIMVYEVLDTLTEYIELS